jgi:molecular chaperone GrpE
MMKRKRDDHEDNGQKNQEQTIDNKTNNQDPETKQADSAADQASGGSSASASANEAGEEASADKVVAQVRQIEEKLAEMQDRYIRLSAEFDNYRKRTLREKMEMSKYAGENLFLSIIPLMDDFDRALSHMDSTTDCNAMKDGILLIYNKFSEFFKQNGIKEIESLNTDFNVDLNEAVAKVAVDDDSKKGKVVDVVLKGYYLQDKVLRFAKVVVGE